MLGPGPAKAAGTAVAVAAFLGAWLVRPPLLAYALVGIAWLAPVTDMQWHYLLIPYVFLVVAVAHVFAQRRATRSVVMPHRASATITTDGRRSAHPTDGEGGPQ
jgi:hypothetical protein